MKANLRRHSQVSSNAAEEEENSELEIGSLIIHPDAYVASKRGETIELTHREFELLHYLAKHMGQVMTREHLLQTVWAMTTSAMFVRWMLPFVVYVRKLKITQVTQHG